jgi:signal peptidase I
MFVESETTPEETQPMTRPGLRRRGWWRDVLEIVALVMIIYTLVNLSTARAVVEGPSMQPNFYTGQLVIVNRFAYYFSQPQRGDVIVLNNPSESCKNIAKSRPVIELPFLGHSTSNGQCEDLIKRVMGLPGETVRIKDGRVYINGMMVEEPYIAHFDDAGDRDQSWTLAENQYFVLGDNRPNSYDSHQFGPIDKNLIVGQAWIRYWPLSDAGMIQHPDYGAVGATPRQPVVSPTPGQ